jgi:hypothetical protein
MKKTRLTGLGGSGIKEAMKKPAILFLLVAILFSMGACASGSGDRIYVQGTWVAVDREEISKLTSDTPSGYPGLVGQWAQSYLNAAFYFTSDLVKLQAGSGFELITKGAGLMVLGPDHKIVGYYEGPQSADPKVTQVAVALVLQNDRSVWQIILRRLWEKGPWLVTELRRGS